MGLRESWDKNIREIQNSPVFWQFTMKGHIDDSISHLCKAYDTHRAALHLSGFLENVARSASVFCESEFRRRHKANPHVDSLAKYPRILNLKSLQEDREFCSKSNPLVANLGRWRNSLVAHFNYAEAVHGTQPFHQRHPLPYEDIKKLIEAGLTILNRYSSLLDETTYSKRIASQQGSDYSYVLKSLRLARFGRRIGMKILHKLASEE